MAITKSAKKAYRQSLRRRKENLGRKRKIKDLTKQFRSLINEKKTAEAKQLLPQLYKALDKATKTGAIKKNTASRKKSRLTRAIKVIKE